MRTLRTQRGFTLVEALVGVAVAVIGLTAAAPDLGRFVEKQRLDGAAAQLAMDIRFARSEAVMHNTRLRLSVQSHAWGSCYVIHTGAASECRCKAHGPAECSGAAQQLKTVVLPASDRLSLESNVASIAFDPLFGTSTPAGTLKLVASSGRAVHHVVNITGRVRMCSPKTAAPAVAGYAVC